MSLPLISIAIATKNREIFCIEAIKSLLTYDNSIVEIAIADNSGTDKIKQFVTSLNAPSLKYRYDGIDNVSSIENFNRAIELTTGQYVMLIGDDDSILPKALEMAQWARENDVDSICSVETLAYYWPNVLEKYPNGVMMMPSSTGKITEVNIKEQLDALLENGLQLYLLYPLPKTYHGIVKRSIMEEIKQRTGHYYGGLSPDIYSSIAVSCIAKNHFVIDEPMSIAGVCANSTTADNLKGKHSGSLENIPHLRHRPNYQFSKKIPLYYSVNTIWAESGLKALEELNEVNLLKKFNVYRLTAQAWIHNRKYISSIMKEKHEELIHNLNINNTIYKVEFAKALIQIVKSKIQRQIDAKQHKKSTTIIENLANLTEVIERYNKETNT